MIKFLVGICIVFISHAGARLSQNSKTDNMTSFPADSLPTRFGFGNLASEDRIRQWDIDVRADGKGLPAGQGTVTHGKEIYQVKCAACHGITGKEGPNDKLVHDPTKNARAKTIGNYWPYATTIYDYIQRAMPFNQPGSLSPDEVYSLTAYLLYENKIIDATAIINDKNLADIQMPARQLFVPDDRTEGPEIR